ncbi:hypothetical protein Pcinc_042071 [Petrolisthes cinctipes]|uniref:Uncharacterized protein n=1 Tax=Petrolisthes cinctipes TaxID=88211 RepID=A0AAE1EGB4_PETCI|nr:hypothetical protein Pcinc_042071 [Petrolisthes cinctipes]
MLSVVLVVVFVGLVAGRPDTIFDFEAEDHAQEQSGEAGESVEGSYSWTSPEGIEFYVKYIADDDGYRVVESNAVPVSHDGQRADGNQGAFGDYEEGEDDE